VPEQAHQDKLMCTAGPRAGSEFRLEAAEVIIGRATDAGIAIADRSVSRRHLQLRRDRTGWLASDLGSGNGTLVNGKPLAGERRLRHADVLTLGETQLTFTDSQTRANDTLTGRQGRSRRGITARTRAAVGACLLLAIVSLGFKLRIDRLHRAAQREAQARAELAALFREGKTLVRDGKWNQASESFQRLRQQAPDYPGLQAYLDRAKVEVPNQQHLATARAAVARDELGGAARALAQLTADTQQHEQLAALQVAINERVQRRLAEARTALGAGQAAAALPILEDLIQAFPENGDAKALGDRARQELAKRSSKQSTRSASTVWEPAVARYRQGELAQAIESASRCTIAGVRQCQSILKRMREVQRLRRQMEKLDLERLERLLDLDRQLGGGKATRALASAMTRAADLYYKRAAAAKAAGHWARAMDFASKTLEAQPGHPEASAMVADMKARAQELFLLAYSAKDGAPEQSLRRLREVLAMTPAGDELHRKAAEWIEKLSR